MEGLTIYYNNKNNKKINPSFSFDFSSDSSSLIDLIKGNICDRKLKWKYEKAKKRLEKKKTCGKFGYPVLIENKIIYQPYSCGCVTCPFCAVKENKKVLAKYFEFFKSLIEKNKELSFITLTVKSSFNLKEVYEKLNLGLRKLYEMRLFGKRTWEKIKKEFYKELEFYRNNLPENERYKAERQKIFFEEFEKKYSYLIGSGLKVGQVFNAVWKLEITFNKKTGWHPHWHGVFFGFIPKLLILVLWKISTKGEGEIVDVRKVRGKKAIRELLKYTTKFWILNGLDEIRILEIETILYNVKKIRHWGLEELEEEAKKEEIEEEKRKKYLWWVRVQLEKENLHDVWEIVREMRERGEVERFYCEAKIFCYQNGESLKTNFYLNQNGELEIKDVRVLEVLKNVERLGDLLPFRIGGNGGGGGGDWVGEKYREIEKQMKINEKSLPF